MAVMDMFAPVKGKPAVNHVRPPQPKQAGVEPEVLAPHGKAMTVKTSPSTSNKELAARLSRRAAMKGG